MTDDPIKTAFERQTKALQLRPGVGRGTARTKVRVREGLTCDVEDGEWKLTVDMNTKWGGANEGPNPGVLGRGALGSCLAIGYKYWAARRGIPIDALEVEIEADYDTRGSTGVADVAASYTEVRYIVSVSSPAPEDEVRAVLDEADRYSSYLEVFATARPMRREIRFTKGDE